MKKLVLLVAALSVASCQSDTKNLEHKVDELNKIRLDLGRQGAITVFDLNKLVSPKGVFTTKLKGNKNIRFVDRSHFSPAGYKIVAAWLVPKLEKLKSKG